MSLLKQDITKKKQVDQVNQALPELKKLKARNNKKYEVKAIINSVIYN